MAELVALLWDLFFLETLLWLVRRVWTLVREFVFLIVLKSHKNRK